MLDPVQTARLDYKAAALRVRAALLKLRLRFKAGFDPDQPRDERGRWTDGGGQVVVTRVYRTGIDRIDNKTDVLVDVAKDIIQQVGPGFGPSYGISVHKQFAATVRALDLPGIGKHGVEESYSLADTVRHGLHGSVRTDVILRDGRTRDASILAVWDLKTGSARLEPRRVSELRAQLGIDDNVPVIEIHVDRGVWVKAVLPVRPARGIALRPF